MTDGKQDSARSQIEIEGQVGRGAAILIDPYNIDAMAEAIRVAATDTDRRGVLREAGLARAARYTWDASAGILAGYRVAILGDMPLAVAQEAARDVGPGRRDRGT